MNCETSQSTFMQFHFSTLAVNKRLELEQHLMSCRNCLSEYFTLKSELDESSRHLETPSPAVRLNIHRAARARIRANTFESPIMSTPRIYWLTASGLAVAASVLIVVFSNKYLNNQTLPPQVSSSVQGDSNQDQTRRSQEFQIDTGRQIPENLNFL